MAFTDQDLTAASQARADFFATLGQVSNERITSLSPMGLGWPAGGGGWVPIKTGEVTLLASDGLSDPFENNAVGIGVEIIMATDEPITDIRRSWLLEATAEISNLIAHNAGGDPITEILDEMGALSAELSMVRSAPDAFVTRAGRVGVIIGINSPAVPRIYPSPGGDVRILIARLLKADELEEIVNGGPDARIRLKSLFERDPQPHVERVNRASYAKAPSPSPGTDSNFKFQPAPPPPGPASDYLAVMGVNTSASEQDIETLFARAGKVLMVRRIGPMVFVKMEDVAAGERAASQLNGYPLNRQPIQITYAQRQKTG